MPLHSPSFDIDEGVLRVGAAFFDEVVRQSKTFYGNGDSGTVSGA